MTSSTRAGVSTRLTARGVIAVVRLSNANDATQVTGALLAGGVDAIEVTLTTAGALDAITTLRGHFGDEVLVGVGSVLDRDAARRAMDAGAMYVVSPITVTEVVAEAHARDVVTMIGAWTPTEMYAAHAAQSDFVKLFPADTAGPAHLKGVLAPMPMLRVVPTGGITAQNAGAWIAAGAQAIGAGSSLVDPSLVKAADWSTLTARARAFIDAVATARGAKA